MTQLAFTINLPADYDRDRLVEIIDAIHDLETGGDTVVLSAGPGPTLNSDGTPAPAPARRGRKSNAEKAAAKQAEAEAAHAATNSAHPAPPPPPPTAVPFTPPPPPPAPPFQQAAMPPVPPLPPTPSPTVSLPPTTPPVHVPPTAAAAAPPPQQSIMQMPAPVGPPGPDGVPTYTRDQVFDAVSRIPGGGALFFNRITKAYGYATVDAVPPEYYNFVMQEIFKPINM